MTELKQHYLKKLPDKPRWVETRDLLAWEGSVLTENEDKSGFVVWSEEDGLGSIVGDAAPTALTQAAEACSELLAFPENICGVQNHLSDFRAEQATIFEAPDSFPKSSTYTCKIIETSDISLMNHLPKELKEELFDLEDDKPLIMAAFDSDLAVAFAYIASETETLWDVSIDTLETHRRKGYAASAVYALMNVMKARGKSAVWGAVQSNTASLNLARKLGFIKVDELWVLSHPRG